MGRDKGDCDDEREADDLHTLTLGHSAAPSGTIRHGLDQWVPGSLPGAAEWGDDQAALAAYGDSVALLRAWLATDQTDTSTGDTSTTSTIPSVATYRRRAQSALAMHDTCEAATLCEVRGEVCHAPMQQRIAALSRAAAMCGAIMAEGAALGAIKPDRDRQTRARVNRQCAAAQTNTMSGKSEASERHRATIRHLAKGITSQPGKGSMSKSDIVKALRRDNLLPADLAAMTDRTLCGMLGDGFGQRRTGGCE